MLDLTLRPIKERILLPFLPLIPLSISPNTLTYIGFLIGLSIPLLSILAHPYLAIIAWTVNRLLDGLDGTLARQRGEPTAWGGYIDIVCDFTVYSLIPIGVAFSPLSPQPDSIILPLSLLLSSFHINNVILFYLSSALPPPPPPSSSTSPEMTSLRLVPAIIEGTESIVFFTFMILFPQWFGPIAWVMSGMVGLNVLQRSWIAYRSFEEVESRKRS